MSTTHDLRPARINALGQFAASIAHEVGFDPLISGFAAHNRQVTALDRVPAKLLPQVALGSAGPGEDQQTAGLLVEAMHGA